MHKTFVFVTEKVVHATYANAILEAMSIAKGRLVKMGKLSRSLLGNS